ncbi:hypothetical protein ACOME3_005640 [Neoechinorhynchus agilis]
MNTSTDTSSDECELIRSRSSSLCHCCYLLYSLNERRKGATYIGYTVDPDRRLNQHNRGCSKGGARKTNGRGPWRSVVVVSGFPNEISGLRFEWAWQNPEKSTRLKHLLPKSKKYNVDFKLNVLGHMLQVGPWSRLNLNVNWITNNGINEWERPLGLYMMRIKINYLRLILFSIEQQQPQQNEIANVEKDIQTKCELCKQELSSNSLQCPNCKVWFHLHCLAVQFIGSAKNRELIPIEGQCSNCYDKLTWSTLIKHLKFRTMNKENE